MHNCDMDDANVDDWMCEKGLGKRRRCGIMNPLHICRKGE
jgi:hypothetical protein